MYEALKWLTKTEMSEEESEKLLQTAIARILKTIADAYMQQECEETHSDAQKKMITCIIHRTTVAILNPITT